MAIFLTEPSKVIVQGMTGSEGTKHTTRMLAAGTQIVGGVNPRKAGTSQTFPLGDATVDIPVFGTVAEAMAATGADVSVVFVPPAFAKAAVMESIEAGMPLTVIITEGIPVADTAEFFTAAQAAGVRLIGPNCPGIISPGRSNVGITPADITGPGRIGLVSQVRHADLPDDVRAAGLRVLHLRSASAATRSSAPRTSTRSRRSRRTRRPTRSS